MKIAILSLLLAVLAVGCSRHESIKAPLPLMLSHGDLASPIELATNKFGARTVYCVPFRLSPAKLAALCQLAQAHPGRDIAIMAGSKTVAHVQAPADPRTIDPSKANMSFQAVYDSISEARAFAESLREFNHEP
jgi:hypothetical protein